MIETTPLRKKLLDLAISGKLVPKTEEWKTVGLDDVVEVLSGQDFPPSGYNDQARGMPYITGASNLLDTGVLVNRWTEKPTVIARAGDILLTCKGSGVGKCAIMDIPEAHIARQIMSLRCKAGITQGYLSTFIKAKFDYFKQNANGLIPGLSRKLVLGMKIPLPPLAEQKRIVKRLEELLALEREIAADNAALDDLITAAKRKILDLAVSGKLVPKTGEWRVCELGEIARVLGGSTPPKGLLSTSGIPYFKVAEMNLPGNEKFLRYTSQYVLVSSRVKTFPSNTIVFPKNGGALLTNKKRILFSESICDLNTGGIILKDASSIDYFFLWFQTVDFNFYVSGGVIPTINASVLKALKVPLPPLAEQKTIVKRVEELFAVLDAMKEL